MKTKAILSLLMVFLLAGVSSNLMAQKRSEYNLKRLASTLRERDKKPLIDSLKMEAKNNQANLRMRQYSFGIFKRGVMAIGNDIQSREISDRLKKTSREYNQQIQNKLESINAIPSSSEHDLYTIESKKLEYEFTKILTGQSSNVGNSATLDTENGSATFVGSIKINRDKILSFRTTGGITEGTQALLNGEDVSPNVSFGLQLNLGLKSLSNPERAIIKEITWRNYLYSLDSIKHADKQEVAKAKRAGFKQRTDSAKLVKQLASISTQTNKLQSQLNQNYREIAGKKIPLSAMDIADAYDYREFLHCQLKFPKGEEQKKIDVDSFDRTECTQRSAIYGSLTDEKEIEKQIDSVNKIIIQKFYQKKERKSLTSDDRQTIGLSLDSLDLEQGILQEELSRLTNLLKDTKPKQELLRRRTNRANATVEAIKPLYKKLEIIRYQLRWFSIAATVRNRSFQLFDSTQVFEKQLIAKSPTNLELGLSMHHYTVSRKVFGSFYSNFSLTFSNDGTFDDLVAIKVDDRKTFLNNPVSRSAGNQITGYIGNFESFRESFRVSWDYYHFIDPNRIFAIHLNPVYFDNTGTSNLTVGFLMGFRDTKDTKNIINAELFYNMQDLFKPDGPEGETERLTERSTLGIRFTTPIVFKTKIEKQ